MARHKPQEADLQVTIEGQPSTSTEEPANVPPQPYQNGPWPEHLSVSKAIASKRVFSWAKSNAVTLVSIAIAAGALWLLPVTRWQLEDTKKDINEKISAVQTKVENHDSAIAKIESTVGRVESKVDAVLLKLTPDRFPTSPTPIPASSPPERPKPRAKRPHPQRVGSLAKTLGLTR